VIVTHTHDDHWDRAAAELIAKDKPIYVQNDRDAALLRSQGFSNLTVMTDATASAIFGYENPRRPARYRSRLRRAGAGGASGRGLWRGAASS
jgi:L-ascorbate metabolism protein UlaG (beta-lactamase superfamily)